MCLKLLYITLSMLMLTHLSIAQSDTPPCEGVPPAKQRGESITFYIYSYQTNKFNEILRVSAVFKVTFAFEPKARVNHSSIGLRFGRDFNYYVRGLRGDGTESPHGIANYTQNKGIFLCLNREAVAEHRLQMIEEHEKWDKKVIEEDEFEFEYTFNQYQKESGNVTTVSVDKL